MLSHIRISSSTIRIWGVVVMGCSDSICFRDPVQGEADDKGRSLSFHAFALDRPAEIFDNAVDNGEAKARVVIPLRRHVRLEEALPDRLGNAGSVVTHGNLDVLFRLALLFS